MNRERAKELLPIIQAYAEGKDVQYSLTGAKWADAPDPVFFDGYRYRIKPEPRVIWFAELECGLVDGPYDYRTDAADKGRPVKFREVMEDA